MIRAGILALALAAGGAAAQGDPPTPEAGRKAYTSFCVRCHGINLVVSGGAFFDLRRFPADDKARFVNSVSKGLRAMTERRREAQPASSFAKRAGPSEARARRR